MIAHEYGHHLGLPDFYSGYSAYNDWNLMATDYSQHMTIFGKQELGWVVPEFLQPGESRNVTDWEEIKNDTGQIKWQTPNGTPYTLSAANGDQNIHNGQAFAAKLPTQADHRPAEGRVAGVGAVRLVVGPRQRLRLLAEGGPQPRHRRCPSSSSCPTGTPITLSFKSSWDIEWDFDYGFVLATTDAARTTRRCRRRRATRRRTRSTRTATPAWHSYDNGLTGTSGAAAGGPAQVAIDRAEGSTASGSPFIADEYDLSQFAGQRGVVLRFSYSTDPGLDRPGWFIDDLEVKAGDEVDLLERLHRPRTSSGSSRAAATRA